FPKVYPFSPVASHGQFASLEQKSRILPPFWISKHNSAVVEMLIIENKGGAIALILAALFFIGTFSVLLTLLERRGRLPQHTFLDYSITNLLASFIIAFGQAGESKPGQANFFTQLTEIHDNWPSVLIAIAGGVFLGLGDLIAQYAWAFAGLTVTNIICSSMTVVIGIYGTLACISDWVLNICLFGGSHLNIHIHNCSATINYFLDGRINRAEMLFPGVACFLIAVFLGAAVPSSNAKDNEQKLSMVKGSGIELRSDIVGIGAVLPDPEDPMNSGDGDNINVTSHAKPGAPEFIIAVEKRRSIKVFGSSKLFGLGLVFLAGLCFSLFAPAINLATNDQ
ncbi:hypothetical protein EJB05_01483, partial [Eragrostis curvula]